MRLKNLLLITFFLVFFLIIPFAKADVLVPSSQGVSLIVLAALLLLNYVINFILIGIQSKIWLHAPFQKIAIGLVPITIIMFILETLSLFLLVGGNLFEVLPTIALWFAYFIIIFACYLIIANYYWKLDKKKVLVTAIIMGILTNPTLLSLL